MNILERKDLQGASLIEADLERSNFEGSHNL
jgi:uncharacterized protein YjbI with pentapeptide repeats